MHKDRVVAGSIHGSSVQEPVRELNIRSDYDVIVCGGGPAGCGAALAAAKEGAKVLMIERYGYPGGMWTAGLVNPLFEGVGRGYVMQDLIDALKANGAWRQWRFAYTFDAEKMILTLENLLTGAGVDLLYYTVVTNVIMDGDTVKGIVIESKAGREAITGKVVIDCTGDGDVAARAGCAYELGRLEDGLFQPMTLMFELGGCEDFPILKTAIDLWDQMDAAIKDNDLDYSIPTERANYAPWIIHTPAPGTAAVQMTHVFKLNTLDPADLTKGTIAARRQAHDAAGVFKYIPGLEKSRLIRTAPSMGLRESRRVRGKYYLELPDLAAGKTFEDAVTACAFVVDIHNPDPDAKPAAQQELRSKPYEIPYRCMVPEDVKGLLTAGRCISGSHEAHASYRVTGTAMGLGQAAGLAAAWAVADKTDVGNVDGKALRAALAGRGAKFLDSAEFKVHRGEDAKDE